MGALGIPQPHFKLRRRTTPEPYDYDKNGGRLQLWIIAGIQSDKHSRCHLPRSRHKGECPGGDSLDVPWRVLDNPAENLLATPLLQMPHEGKSDYNYS